MVTSGDPRSTAGQSSMSSPDQTALSPDIAAVHYAEIDLISAQDVTRCRERGSHPVKVLRVNAGGQALERDEATVHRHAPHEVSLLVEVDLIGVDVRDT
jgi:hypothetical protein